MPSKPLVLCHPFPLLFPIFPNIRVFSSESALCIRWPKYWSFSFSISPFNDYSGLISFRINWRDLFAIQGTLKSLLQHHILKESILQQLALFMVQLSHLYMTTGKTIALTIQTLLAEWCLCFFNMLFRFLIAILARNKCVLIWWLQSLSIVILEPKKRKSIIASTFPPFLCHEMMGPDAMILVLKVEF